MYVPENYDQTLNEKFFVFGIYAYSIPPLGWHKAARCAILLYGLSCTQV
jgi:hypothetical protein